jgi:hypothetical protein
VPDQDEAVQALLLPPRVEALKEEILSAGPVLTSEGRPTCMCNSNQAAAAAAAAACGALALPRVEALKEEVPSAGNVLASEGRPACMQHKTHCGMLSICTSRYCGSTKTCLSTTCGSACLGARPATKPAAWPAFSYLKRPNRSHQEHACSTFSATKLDWQQLRMWLRNLTAVSPASQHTVHSARNQITVTRKLETRRSEYLLQMHCCWLRT